MRNKVKTRKLDLADLGEFCHAKEYARETFLQCIPNILTHPTYRYGRDATDELLEKLAEVKTQVTQLIKPSKHPILKVAV